MKRCLYCCGMLLLVLCLLVPGAATGGQREIASHQEAPAPSIEIISLTPGGKSFALRGLLADADGGLLLCGNLVFPDETIEEPEDIGFEVLPERTEAYAIALDAQGEKRWSWRMADPQSTCQFARPWPLADDRVILPFSAAERSGGMYYYILGAGGQVDGMLPLDGLREDGVLYALHPVAGGYIAGGFHYDYAIGVMNRQSAIVRYDASMTELWRLSDERLIGHRYGSMLEMADGYLFYGELSRIGQGYYIPAMTMIGNDGSILWQYRGHKYAATDIAGACACDDGGILFICANDPQSATPNGAEPFASLAKLSASGEFQWSRSYLDTHGIARFTGTRPFGDGYLLCGAMAADESAYGLLYVDAEGDPLGFHAPALGDGDAMLSDVALTGGPDGSAYLTGNRYWLEDPDSGLWKLERMEGFYAHIEPADMAGAGQ